MKCNAVFGRLRLLLLPLLPVAIALLATATARPQSPEPSVSTVSLSGSNLTLSGSGGSLGGTFYVLASTNVDLRPLTSWTRVATNAFAKDGTFSANISIFPATAQQFFTVSATMASPNLVGVFTYHNDSLRTGQNLNETVLTTTNVNSTTFGKLFTYALDGNSFASPVYASRVDVPGKGTHNLVFAATEHDSVYAFDADGLTNQPIWKVSFIKPASGITTVPASDTGETGDIQNEIGITSTPVIDPATATIYVVVKTKETSGNKTSYVQKLHALDLASGAEKLGGPVIIQANVPVQFDPLRQNQRSAILLANGIVYLAFASHGDNQPYYGWLLGYDATTLQQTMAFNTAPGGGLAGIWMNGDGPAVDTAGNLYFITGNGSFNADVGGKDYGDSFVKLTPAGAVLDYFTPHEQSDLSAEDLDLCSGGVLLLPDQPDPHPHEMVSSGKNGTIYVADRDNMGRYSSTTDRVVQSIPNIFQNATGIEGGNFSSPVYFNGFVYFSPVADYVQAFRLTNGVLSTTPASHSSGQYGGRGGTMAISANGGANGILWTLETRSSSPGVLHAYDALDLTHELYNSNQAGARDALDVWQKFTVPVIANGKLYITSVGQLTIYGLR
jgi:hypothetical protein